MTWVKPVRIALQVLALANVPLLAIDWPHFGMTNKVLMLTVAGGAIGVSYLEHPEHLGLPGRPRKRVLLAAAVVLAGGIAWLAAGAPR